MINREEEIHPQGCMCVDCRIERGEISEEEVEAESQEYPNKPNGQPAQQRPTQQVEAPPRQRRSPGRPRKNGNSQMSNLPNTYTRPVQPPEHFHARYEYAYGPLRRCHLCSPTEEHMTYLDGEHPIWFATLEDRARHILEVHTLNSGGDDAANEIIKRERGRAREILGISDIWNRHAPMKLEQIRQERPPQQMQEYVYEEPIREEKPSVLSSLFGKKKQRNGRSQPKQPNWFSRHKIITVVLIIILLYGIYCYYLLTQGYEF
jgi:hypothetical protein